MKRRYQRMEVKKRTDRGRAYWYCRYVEDVPNASGVIEPVQRRHFLGWAEGKDKVKKEDAEIERDKLRARLNAPSVVQGGAILFGRIAELWRQNHASARANKVAAPTQQKYLFHLDTRILQKWENYRLGEITTLEIEQWLLSLNKMPRKKKKTKAREATATATPDPAPTGPQPQDTGEPVSWNTRNDIRGVMSSIFTKATDWGYYELRNPVEKVDIGRKTEVYERRILNEDETACVLAKLPAIYRLIVLTALSTSTRISEILGLQARHFDATRGTIAIRQRWYRGDLDVTKTPNSVRDLTLGILVDDYRKLAQGLKPDAYLFTRADGSGKPIWDSTVREELKAAARAAGCDFPGFGMHSFRRANITWRQEEGATSIEAQKIAGHSKATTTMVYTQVQLDRQRETTLRIQNRLFRTANDANAEAQAQDHDGAPPAAARPN